MQFSKKHRYIYDCCVEDEDYERLSWKLRDFGFGTYPEAAVEFALKTLDGTAPGEKVTT